MKTLSVLALSRSEETVEKWEDLMVLTMIIQQTNIWPSLHFLLPPISSHPLAYCLLSWLLSFWRIFLKPLSNPHLQKHVDSVRG